MSSCCDSEGVYHKITQAWFWVPCIESFITMKVYPCSVWISFWLDDSRWSQQRIQIQRRVLGSQKGNLSSFELFHSWCVSFMYEWSELGQWHVPVQINDLLCTPLFSLFFGSFIPFFFFFFCLYSHNSVNFVIGISSMRLNEGSIQISSQMVAKSQEAPVLVLGLIFIEITRGPFTIHHCEFYLKAWYVSMW